MGDKTSIEWTDATWNPTKGCSLAGRDCRNCYAMRDAIRQAGPGKPYEGLVESTPHGPMWTGVVRSDRKALDLPLRWKRPRKIFVNSMSDLFHETLTFGAIAEIFEIMRRTPRHTYQILTKRPERMLSFVTAYLDGGAGEWPGINPGGELPPHIWLGISAGAQPELDKRIQFLIPLRAAVRWLSLEPLFEAVTLRPRPDGDRTLCLHCGAGADAQHDGHTYRTRGIDWVVVGGESGPHARECRVEWIQAIAGECERARVPLFVKQYGAKPTFDEVLWRGMDPTPLLDHRNDAGPGRVRFKLSDRKGGNAAEWPIAFRRYWPGDAA